MPSQLMVFKCLRCIGLFPRQLIPPNHSDTHGRSTSGIGPISPFLLSTTIAFHVMLFIVNVFYLRDFSSGIGGLDGLNHLCLFMWGGVWVWAKTLACWTLLLHHNKMVQLHRLLMTLHFNKYKEKIDNKMIPKTRLFLAIFIFLVNIVQYFINEVHKKVNFLNLAAALSSAIGSLAFHLLTEFTFLNIELIYRDIICPIAFLSCKVGDKKTVKAVAIDRLYLRQLNARIPSVIECTGMKKFRKTSMKLTILQIEKRLALTDQSTEVAMEIFGYGIIFLMFEQVLSSTLSIYFAIQTKNKVKSLFKLVELCRCVPSVILFTTLSSGINREVPVQK